MDRIPEILLVGSSFSGKSTLAAIWAGQERGTHRVTPNVTVTPVSLKQVTSLFVIDCGGTAISRMVALEQIKYVDVIVFVFDSTSVASFDEMKDLFNKVGKTQKILVLIGTKTDLESKVLGASDSQIDRFAKENGMKLFRTCLSTAMEPLEWITAELLRRPNQLVN